MLLETGVQPLHLPAMQRVKMLRLDNRGKYTSKAVGKYLSEKGIRHQKSVPYTSMQNDVAKRINRTIQERVMAML